MAFHISGRVKVDSPITPWGFQTGVSQGWVWKMNRRLARPAARAGLASNSL
jgi:hypothetical protein